MVDVSVGRTVWDDDQPVFLCGRRLRQLQYMNIAMTIFAQFAVHFFFTKHVKKKSELFDFFACKQLSSL